MNPLTEWLVFYQIVGSAAGALTGLQFVVMAFIADLPMKPGEDGAGEAFATPTIVHFVTVLMLSASVVMPWHGLTLPAGVWCLAGLAGCAYTLVVAVRMRRQKAYRPVLEDWAFHCVLPILTYAALVASACALISHTRGPLFGIAGSALLLLFIGIHNAWDNVTYLVFVRRKELQKQSN